MTDNLVHQDDPLLRYSDDADLYRFREKAGSVK
jgi:hypothetical protein